MGELSPKKTGLSLAIVFGIFYLVCAILFALAPASTMSLFNSLFHGIDVSEIARESISLGETAFGLLIILVFGWIVGWLYAVIYNKLG